MPRPPARHLAAALALALAACGRGAPPPPTPASTAAGPTAGEAAVTVRFSPVQPVRHAPRIVVTGTLKARQSAPLAFAVGGPLARIAVKRGQEVAAGNLLGALDDAIAAAQRKQAEAALAAARAQLAIAEDALQRVQAIRAEDGVSEAQAFQARSQRDLAAAQVTVAEAQVAQAAAALDHHYLRAPFAGVVTRVPDGVGITVGPGVPLFAVASTRVLYLDTSVSPDQAGSVRAGTRAEVTVPTTGASSAEATVQVVVGAIDPATSRVPVEIAVPNGDGRFLANAFARAELPRGPEQPAFRVPAGALLQRDGGFAIWSAGADGRARPLPVRVLEEAGDEAIVGLPGDRWPEGVRAFVPPSTGIAEGILVGEVSR